MKKHRKKAATLAGAPKPLVMPQWAVPALIAALVLIFYWAPLTSANASIQWDAADLHYPMQKYFSDHIRAGDIPFWTPYLFSGYPLMAYPELGAWYPPNWPFFLMGITPRVVEAELALNAFLACLGAFLLLSRVVERKTAALLGALCYGLSGFFAGHSSHLGIFTGAACFPWLLLAFRNALDKAAVRYTVLGGFVGAAIILAGYIQTAMYGFLALGLYALADIYRAPRRWPKIAAVAACMLLVAVTVAAIQIVPTLELTRTSFRAHSDYSRTTEGLLEFRALPTLVFADWLGAISGKYTGPFDITQFYFYAGLLLLPLAALGIAKTKKRLHALLLIIPAMWFMFGPYGGLYYAAMYIPGMNKVRAPIQGWFIVALGLAMLAALGFDWLQQRWRVRYLGAAVLAILFADLWYWNMIANPIAYAHAGFDRIYGAGQNFLEQRVVPLMPPLARYDAGRARLGPLDATLNLKLEAVSGYAALPVSNYMQYLRAMWDGNPKLRDGLNVAAYVRGGTTLVRNANALPRVYFPKAIADFTDREAAVRALKTLDPNVNSIALVPHAPIQQDPAATATMSSFDEESYRINYHAASPSMLRLAVPYFAGWQARVNGRATPITQIDVGLMGVVVPPGDGEVGFTFCPHSFWVGAGISAVSLLAAILIVLAPAIRNRFAKHAAA